MFLFLWLLGEVCYVIQVLIDFGWVVWMMFNYLLNIIFIMIVLYYKAKRHDTVSSNKESNMNVETTIAKGIIDIHIDYWIDRAAVIFTAADSIKDTKKQYCDN